MTLSELRAEPSTFASRLATTWSSVCRLDDLEPQWGEAALLANDQVALFRMPDGRLFATSNCDPETGAMVMSRGIVGSRTSDGVARPTVASPLHKDIYDLETGHCYTNAALRLPVWRTRIDEGVVRVAKLPALIAASHGTRDAAGQAAVAALVAAVRAADSRIAVMDAFVDVQSPDVATVTADCGGDAVIVPLLLSAGYHVHVDLAAAAAEHRASGRGAVVTPALGPDVRLATVLARRLREAGWRQADRVVLAAAGSSDPGAVADCRAAARLLARELDAPVEVGFVSAAAPRLGTAVARATTTAPEARVVVASYLLAPGYFQELATEQARAGGAALITEPLLTAHDEPAAELVDLVRERFGAAVE